MLVKLHEEVESTQRQHYLFFTGRANGVDQHSQCSVSIKPALLISLAPQSSAGLKSADVTRGSLWPGEPALISWRTGCRMSRIDCRAGREQRMG